MNPPAPYEYTPPPYPTVISPPYVSSLFLSLFLPLSFFLFTLFFLYLPPPLSCPSCFYFLFLFVLIDPSLSFSYLFLSLSRYRKRARQGTTTPSRHDPLLPSPRSGFVIGVVVWSLPIRPCFVERGRSGKRGTDGGVDGGCFHLATTDFKGFVLSHARG